MLHPHLPALCLAAALVPTLPLPAQAEGLGGVLVTWRGDADRLIDDTDRVREFRHGSQLGFGPAGPDHASLTHHLSWASAHRVEPGGPTVALTWGNRVDYALGFQVDDPMARGYTLSFDTLMRGYLTAQWLGNAGAGISQIFGAGTLMVPELTGPGGTQTVTALSTPTEVVLATAADPFANLRVERAGAYDAGHFVGTQFFTLGFWTVGANTQAALQNHNTGEVAVRFGAELTSPRFAVAGYPGVDGDPASALGHFVTVHVAYDVAPIPEPATTALWLGGGLALAALRRRRRAAGGPA